MQNSPSSEEGFSRDPLLPSEARPTLASHAPDDEVQSLSREEGDSTLSSLAERRAKYIKIARILLFFLGILQIGMSISELLIFQSEIDRVRAVGVVRPPSEEAQFEVRLIIYVFIAAGVSYLILGLLVGLFPVPCTVLGFFVFLGVHATALIANPSGIIQGNILIIIFGIILKIIFVLLFVRAIKAARAYQYEKARAEALEHFT